MLIISKDIVQQCIDMPKAIALMAEAFTELSLGKGQVPVRHFIENDATKTTGLFMPASLPNNGSLGIKVVGFNEKNLTKNMPFIHASILLLDTETGKPKALMEAGWITALRTGAGSGLATSLLAKPDAKNVVLFGAGVQARTQLEAVCTVREVASVKIINRTKENAEAFCQEMEAKLSIPITLGNVKDLNDADIICTATNSVHPLFQHSSIKHGVHINAVGAYTPLMAEIPQETVAASSIIVDRLDGCLAEAGDIIQAIEQGAISVDAIRGELGELVGKKIAIKQEETTLFKSVGNAAQDVVVANYIFNEATKRNLGQFVEL